MTEAKPPPQIAGVSGIASQFAAGPAAKPINWPALSKLSPFQMFMSAGGSDAQQDALRRARERGSDQGLLDEYVQWHTDSGRWPNETPFGEVK